MRAPRSLPRKFAGATSTRGLRRMRRTFHVLAALQTSSRSPSSLTTHTGVDTGVPSRLKVVRLM
jgi:hypothetical protein